MAKLTENKIKRASRTRQLIGRKKGPHVLDVMMRRAILNQHCPEHYAGKVTPWDLQRCMTSTGNVFVDARRTDAIEYCFRLKNDGLLADLKKAIHCLQAAVEELENQPT